jgi:hypothetical protein
MKKLAVISLTLIVLASLGLGYGIWSQDFNSYGPVSTGSFDVIFDSFTAPSSSYGAGFAVYQVDSHTCEIRLSDLYPTCNPVFDFVLKDAGSIPARITDIKIDGVSIISGGTVTPVDKDLDGDGNKDITITVSGINSSGPNSLINANNGTLHGSLTVRTWAKISSDGNDATANASGGFSFEIDTAQNP